ncbi:MFS transporter, partial [bacterium]
MANLAYALSSSMLGPSLPAIINSLSLDAWGVSAITSAVAMGFFSVLPGGALADRRGKKKLMLAGLFIEMMGYSLAGVSQTFQPLLLSLVLFGIGAGFWEVAVSAFIPDTFADSPSGPMNILHSMWGIGGFLGPLLVGLVISSSRDWHPSFLVAAVLLVAAQMAILFLKEGGRQTSGIPRPLSAIGSVPKGAVVALALGWG